MPGILCWGDSLTAGYGGDGVSYPEVLQELINNNVIDGINVMNMGVCVETTHSIMTRADVFNLYACDFIIPADKYAVEFKLYVDYGFYLNIASNGDAGLNPVTINGIKGIIKYKCEDDELGGKIYEFTRLESGEECHVEHGTKIHVDSENKYQGFFNIVFMGQNGIYSTDEELVYQCRQFADKIGTDRYIFVGLTTGGLEKRGNLENLMQEAFGNHYLNIREGMINNGKQILSLPERDNDYYFRETGQVYSELMSDEIHFNSLGYRIIAHLLYERMENLGYFTPIKEALSKYNY